MDETPNFAQVHAGISQLSLSHGALHGEHDGISDVLISDAWMTLSGFFISHGNSWSISPEDDQNQGQYATDDG